MIKRGVVLCILTLVTSMANGASDERIFEYIGSGNLPATERAITEGANVNHASKHGETLLMRAASTKQFSIVKFLVQKGAKVETRDKYGFTVIDILESNIRRAGTNRDKMVNAMRAQGLSDDAILKLIGKKGATEADRKSWDEILQYLRERGPVANLKK